MNNLNAIFTIAYRDFVKLLRDKFRLLASLVFPIIFIGALGGSLQSNLGSIVGFDFLKFVFIGSLAQILFQSTAQGVIYLIEDRENDFSQEIFVSPISRYSIIFGKILGETLVSFAQILGIIVFGFIIGVHLTPFQLLMVIPIGFLVSIFGGAFGLLVMANISNHRSATQVFPFFIFPQIFLAGVFSPIKELPPVLFVLSRISPLTYAVDFMRGVFYWGSDEYSKVTLYHPLFDLLIMSALFIAFMLIGTFLFVKNERNR